MIDPSSPGWPPRGSAAERETHAARETLPERLQVARRADQCPFIVSVTGETRASTEDPSWPALRRVLDILPQLLLLCDGDARILHVNQSARQWFLARSAWDDLEPAVHLACERLSAFDEPAANGNHTARVSSYTVDGWYRIEAVCVGELGAPRARVAVLVVLEPPEGPSQLDAALRRRYHLTHSETRVARLLAQGKTNRQIATDLHVSIHTIRHHVEHIFGKLSIHTRSALRNILAERGS